MTGCANAWREQIDTGYPPPDPNKPAWQLFRELDERNAREWRR